MNKITTLDKVAEKFRDGMTVMIGGFNGICAPIVLIDKLAKSGVKDLTLITVTCGHPGGGFDLAPLFVNKQVKKVITTHTGTSPEATKYYKEGGMEVEYRPMGIWMESIRAGGFGLGGVVSKRYRGDEKENGKKLVAMDGVEYVVETPLRADIAFVKGYRGDPYGNIQHRRASANVNSIMASAADYTIAEVNEIVGVGDIDPDHVGIVGPFVQAVVQGNTREEHEKIYQELWDSRGRLAKSEEAPACDPNDIREIIARRAALEIKNGDVVNLGIGIPTQAANYIPEGMKIFLQAENGVLGFGKTPVVGKQDADLFNAGAQPVTFTPGAATFNLETSFGLIRGGYVDVTILGTLEVDQHGNIANWGMELAPGTGRIGPGMGGAMELVNGARKVVVVMQHTDKKGNSKVLKNCVLPLTGRGVVDVIITEQAVFNVTPDGLVLKEIFPGLTVEDIRAITAADFTVASDCCEYQRAFEK